MKTSRFLAAVTGLASLLAVGCASVGPNTISRDRFDYSEAISSSFKEQLLLNIVRLRYTDPPMFVEVSSVVNQYSLESDVSVSGSWSDGISDDVRGIGARGRFTDRPTITYTPMVGQQFTRALMTPLAPGVVLFLVQSGWSVDTMFRITVQAVNGVYNRAGAPAMGRAEPDAEYVEMLEAMKRIQMSGSIGMRVENPERPESAVLVIRRSTSPEVAADSETLRRILKLPLGSTDFKVVYGADAIGDSTLAIQTRSILEIMIELASEITVPEEHVAEGRTYPSTLAMDDPDRLIDIRSSQQKPRDAFVSVRYRDLWFYIDDRDLRSKRTFAFLNVLYNVTQTGESAVPVLTIPAG